MVTSGKGTATVGYNVQIAVDAEHHLTVAHEVINQGYDRHQLAPMSFKAQQATGCEQITALADRGYFNGDQVLSCDGTGVAPVVPKTLTSSGTKRGLLVAVVPLIGHLVGHDQMVLGVDGDLYIVADGGGAFAAGRHRTGVGIGQRDLLVGCV